MQLGGQSISISLRDLPFAFQQINDSVESAGSTPGIEDYEAKVKDALNIVINHPGFLQKYDMVLPDSGYVPFVHSPISFDRFITIETFATVCNPTNITQTITEDEMVFHPMFESVIERYTGSNKKPNHTLIETRCSDFCYHLEMYIEAVEYSDPSDLMLVRHYLILRHLWETFRQEFIHVKSSLDQMTGFQMPFEFQNVSGSKFDFYQQDQCDYYSIDGSIRQATKGGDSDIELHSSLSYMSCEKVGPNIKYLSDLLQSQGRIMTMATALKVYDQLLCRLLVMHKYGVIHANLKPDILHFGCRDATSVLYITAFESSICTPSTCHYLPKYSSRFAAIDVTKRRLCHFVNDLESAFYIFLWLLFGRLPWDQANRESKKLEFADLSSASIQIARMKEQFWSDNNFVQRIFGAAPMEFDDSLYRSFVSDLLMSLYTRVKETITFGKDLIQADYVTELASPNSQSYNGFIAQRKIIVSYFRFESLNDSLKDILCAKKVEMLTKEETVDRRIAWNLSNWCWSYLIIKGGVQMRRSTFLSKQSSLL